MHMNENTLSPFTLETTKCYGLASAVYAVEDLVMLGRNPSPQNGSLDQTVLILYLRDRNEGAPLKDP